MMNTAAEVGLPCFSQGRRHVTAFFVAGIFVLCLLSIKIQANNRILFRDSSFSSPGWKTVQMFVGNTTYGTQQAWYSQAGQDKTVCEVFELLYGTCNDRFFLDLAAHDAEYLSNTKSLEEHYNWKGVCIEANHDYMWGLAHRRCDVYNAIVSSTKGDMVEFVEYPGGDGALGGIVSLQTDNKHKGEDSIVRQATSLLDILHKSNAPRIIDYLSFDVEGAEDMILQESVLDEFTFLIITVERPSKELRQRLEQCSYVYVRDHGAHGDAMFVHSTLDSIQDVLSRFGSSSFS